MTTRLKSKLDYSDYADLPNDGKRYEIIDGDLYVTPAPGPAHQHALGKLFRCLQDYFEARGIGEVFFAPIDLILTVRDVVQPDLVVTESRQVSARGIEGAPLLVVEILSPSTRSQDRNVKAQRYATLGVPHYWIVDPEARRLECYRLESGAYALVVEEAGSAEIGHPDWPGLTIALTRLWR